MTSTSNPKQPASAPAQLATFSMTSISNPKQPASAPAQLATTSMTSTSSPKQHASVPAQLATSNHSTRENNNRDCFTMRMIEFKNWLDHTKCLLDTVSYGVVSRKDDDCYAEMLKCYTNYKISYNTNYTEMCDDIDNCVMALEHISADLENTPDQLTFSSNYTLKECNQKDFIMKMNEFKQALDHNKCFLDNLCYGVVSCEDEAYYKECLECYNNYKILDSTNYTEICHIIDDFVLSLKKASAELGNAEYAADGQWRERNNI